MPAAGGGKRDCAFRTWSFQSRRRHTLNSPPGVQGRLRCGRPEWWRGAGFRSGTLEVSRDLKASRYGAGGKAPQPQSGHPYPGTSAAASGVQSHGICCHLWSACRDPAGLRFCCHKAGRAGDSPVVSTNSAGCLLCVKETITEQGSVCPSLRLTQPASVSPVHRVFVECVFHAASLHGLDLGGARAVSSRTDDPLSESKT